MLYVLNRHRNLMADPVEAVQNLREIEAATHLHVTGLVDNAHLKDETDEIALRDDDGDAETVSELSRVCPSWQRPSPKGSLGIRNKFLQVRNMPRWSILYVYMSRIPGNDRVERGAYTWRK